LKLEDKLDLSQLNQHPGFATTIFVSWDEISDYFELFELWPVCRDEEDIPEELVNQAFAEAREWARFYVEKRGLPPSDKAITSTESNILQSLRRHWSSTKILDGVFDFASYVADTNKWSHGGAKQPQIFGVTPTPGKSVDYIINVLGINLTIYPPFMIPYTEIYYQFYDGLPEWDYDDLNGMDIIETLFAVHEQNNDEIEIDLTDWDAKWESENLNFMTDDKRFN